MVERKDNREKEREKERERERELERELQEWERNLNREFGLSFGFALIIWILSIIIPFLNISLLVDYIFMVLAINVGVSFILELIEWNMHDTLKFTHMLIYFVVIDGLEIQLLCAIVGLM